MRVLLFRGADLAANLTHGEVPRSRVRRLDAVVRVDVDVEWFTAETWRGPYATFDVETLPEQVQFIPPEYRKYWERGSKESWASPFKLTKKPEMKSVRGSSVAYAEDLTGVDLYRYRSQWYLMEDGQWFHSDSWKGPFMAVPVSQVPSAVRNVPVLYRRYWQTSAIG